jgi:CheY-like chemotaxis protein
MGSAAAQRPMVLVVEDSQDLLELYELVLSDAGYRVAAAPEGRAGLDLACRVHPAAVLLDMMMPDMDGLEFLRQLPSCGQPLPPVIVVSGFAQFAAPAHAAGARAFLRKPVSPDEVLAALDRALAGAEEPAPGKAQVDRVASGREEASLARERLWSRVDLDDPELRATLEGVLAWLSRYHGFGTGLVDLLRAGRIFIAAGQEPRISVDREVALCADVIDAGSSLVVADVDAHPVFAGHEASTFFGTRFYVGCPITLRSGLVVGTVCLVDVVPRRVGLGDMRVLEYLARRIAARFEAMAEGRRPPPFFEPPELFEPEAVEVVLEAQLAAERDVALVLVGLARAGGAPAPFARAAEVLHDAALAARFAAARWTDDTLAFVLGGPEAPGEVDRAIASLRAAGLAITAAGVAECARAACGLVAAGEMIGLAEAAAARSGAAGGALVRSGVPAVSRDAA